MTFKIDYRDGDVYRWTATADGATVERDTTYTPRFYVAGESPTAVADARGHLACHPGVADAAIEEWRTGWRTDPEPVVRVEARSLEALRDVAGEVRGWGEPGEYTLYNVDFAREFRYCLENGIDPVPDDEGLLSTLALDLSPKALNDGRIDALRIDGEPAVADGTGGDRDASADAAPAVLDAVASRIAERDPDVLVLSSAELVPLLYREARRHDRPDFELGRLPGWQQLAAESTYESYGRVGHSPARYNVPGRAIVDVSNSFFWRQTNLGGLLDLVGRSRKPLQETAWASIGNVLTSIQVRVATARGVLVPWNSWRHEQFKPMSTLHEADRGGFIFSPTVGFHEDVHELDFSSLYPKIMLTYNVSPETVRCECHPDREDVPRLGYGVCPEDGYIKAVLRPIVDDRDRFKRRIAALERALERVSDDTPGTESGTGAGPGAGTEPASRATLDALASALEAALEAELEEEAALPEGATPAEPPEEALASAMETELEALEALTTRGAATADGTAATADGTATTADGTATTVDGPSTGDVAAAARARVDALQGKADALKWILVSCFGYQGFSNAKFGRIECHEAINAYAREILLDTKETLEAHGWEVVHGIVDSLWVRARSDAAQTPLGEVAAEVTDDVGIRLEYETAYDWIAFAPRRESDEGALNRYFGKLAGEDGFKKRGIELRQRSTPAFVEDCQRAWLETLDAHREPAPVCEQLRVQLAELRAGRVDPATLLVRRRVSKDREEYTQYTRNVAALERAAVQDFAVAPGEDVEYVVVDDDARSAARVRLAYESLDRYDADFYADLLVRAAESVLSPFGWDRRRIRRYLADTEDAAITAY